MKKDKFYQKKFSKNLKIANRLKTVLHFFQDKHFENILDIGCGDGTFTKSLSKYCDHICGIDISQEAVGKAKENGIKALTVDIDDSSFPFENNSFEAIYCGEVIEHLYNTDHLIDEIYRVLKPEGICVITTPNLSWWLNRIVLLFGFQPYLTEVSLNFNVGKFNVKNNEISGHIRAFTHRSLKELLLLHNFSISKRLRSDVGDVFGFPLNVVEKIFSYFIAMTHSNIFVVTKKGI